MLAPLRIGQVEAERALVAVQARKVGGHAIGERRAPAAGVVAIRSFDLERGAQDGDAVLYRTRGYPAPPAGDTASDD